jgi:arsenate reductase (glutaredoxin)
VDIWFNPKCSKCRIAADAFDEAGLTYDLRRYLDEPPTPEEFTDVLAKLGLEPWEVCRIPDATAQGIDLPPHRDDAHREDWIEVMVAHPSIIQRPIVVTDDGSAYVVRDSETLSALTDRANPIA